MSASIAAWLNLIMIFLFFTFTAPFFLGIPLIVMTVGVIFKVYKAGQWWWNPLLIWDLAVNVMTNGSPHNTISARCGYWMLQGCPVATRMVPVIDWFLRDPGHCVNAWHWQISVGVEPKMRALPFFKKHVENSTPAELKSYVTPNPEFKSAMKKVVDAK